MQMTAQADGTLGGYRLGMRCAWAVMWVMEAHRHDLACTGCAAHIYLVTECNVGFMAVHFGLNIREMLGCREFLREPRIGPQNITMSTLLCPVVLCALSQMMCVFGVPYEADRLACQNCLPPLASLTLYNILCDARGFVTFPIMNLGPEKPQFKKNYMVSAWLLKCAFLCDHFNMTKLPTPRGTCVSRKFKCHNHVAQLD